MIEKRGVVSNNIEKRRATILKKCEECGITTDEYYSNQGKKSVANMSPEAIRQRTEKSMKTKLDSNRVSGRSYYKSYKLYDKNIIVQGYEPIVLDYLQNVINEEQLTVANGKKLDSFVYNTSEGQRIYYPDMFIPGFVVEVKSQYTLDSNRENVFNKIGGVFDAGRSILLVVPKIQEVRKGKLEGSKKLLDWAISSQSSKENITSCVVIYDEGSTTIQIGVESSDSKYRDSGRVLSECDIVWSQLKDWVGE